MTKILNLEWTSFPSRDRESATIIANYLRYQNYNVLEGSIFNGFNLIDKYKPEIVFMTNIIGARINYQIAKYVKQKRLPLVTSLSEGIIRENTSNTVVWGHNSDRIPIEDILLVWSNKSLKLVLETSNDYFDIAKVSGGVGFDRFLFSSPGNNWLSEIEKYVKQKYNLVVGVGCWSWDAWHEDNKMKDIEIDRMDRKTWDRFCFDREAFSENLYHLIKRNSKVLFLLKEHPGTQFGYWASGIERCVDLENVVIMKNDRSIFDCISVSDIWISYESTTAIEAWLMGKQTGLLNPSGTNFPDRTIIYRGQPNYRDYVSLQTALDFFKEYNCLPGFKELQQKRKEIIAETIGYDDGLNHVRYGNHIIKYLESGKEPKALPDNILPPTRKQQLHQRVSWALSRSLYRYIKPNKLYQMHASKWNDAELIALSELRMQEQVDFYEKKGLSKVDLLKI